jgi:hypothetical protein
MNIALHSSFLQLVHRSSLKFPFRETQTKKHLGNLNKTIISASQTLSTTNTLHHRKTPFHSVENGRSPQQLCG